MKTMKYGKGYTCGIIDSLHFVAKVEKLKAPDRNRYGIHPTDAQHCSILKIVTLPDKRSERLIKDHEVCSVYHVGNFLILIAFHYTSSRSAQMKYLAYRLENNNGTIEANPCYDIHVLNIRYWVGYVVENLLQVPTRPELFGFATTIREYDNYDNNQLSVIIWNILTGDQVFKLTIPIGKNIKRIEHVNLVNDKALAVVYHDLSLGKTFGQFYDIETGLLYYNQKI
jgi:hypothetical protein